MQNGHIGLLLHMVNLSKIEKCVLSFSATAAGICVCVCVCVCVSVCFKRPCKVTDIFPEWEIIVDMLFKYTFNPNLLILHFSVFKIAFSFQGLQQKQLVSAYMHISQSLHQ